MNARFSLDPNNKVLRVSYDEPLCEQMIPLIRLMFTSHLEDGVRRIIVDRRNGTNLSADVALKFGSEMGELCSRYQARVAVIVKDDDIMEYIVCGGAFVVGSKMITTVSEREAEQWVSGQVR